MSRAFVKEPDGDQVADDTPDRPVSPHANYVTPEGLAAIEGELERLRADHAAAVASGDKATQHRANRELRYWTARRATAQLVEPQAQDGVVRFGATVTIEREDGRTQTFRITGEDEADPAKGAISYVSPLARALIGKSVGDEANVAGAAVEITAIA
ncbi:MAG: transcription elongation factor GreA [Caulobacteraceae bacterium]